MWGRIRAAQLHAGRQMVLFLLAANLVSAAIIVTMFGAVIPAWQLWGHVGAIAAIAVAVTVRRLRTPDSPDGYASVADLRRTWPEGLALGLAWSVAPLMLGPDADAATALGLWMVLSVLMTAAAVAMAPLVLAVGLFIGGIAAAVALPLAFTGNYIAAAAVTLFAALLILIAIGRARGLVDLRGSELTLADRDETVSMLLREFGDAGADWLWETDAARRIVKASPRFAIACGVEPGAIDGTPFLQVLAGSTWESGDVSPALRDLSEKMRARQSFRDLVLPVGIGGKERWWSIAASPRFDGTGQFAGFRGVGSDVTEQRLTADKIARMARFDPLTGLPNRLSVNEALTRALEEATHWQSRCAFMMIDLDRFKVVNDTLGHPVGDRLLGRVSERLARLTTDGDIVGRLGGDEFAVVVRDARDGERVERLARAIIDALSQPYDLDEHTLYIGASVGVATSPRDGSTAETLVRSADLALYRSKDRGGGVFHAYEPQLHVAAEERRVLEMALRKALQNGELRLQYQPVVAAADGALRGFEALLRWEHPTLGNIPPAKFVPIAEETRLIGPIGEWVVRSACAEAAGWSGDLSVAVNVSPEQLHSPQFAATVASALAQTGLAAHRLELEVTESVFLREGTGAVRVLERILDLGVKLSLDDFGTGYSSLGYLARTRFSTIKIDRSFVAAAAQGVPEPVAIIRAVVALANSLGMATTAEGVETERELETIRGLGCTRIQGYYFGRPLPVAEARALVERRADASRAA
ncbi:putative bifunctional diguanylate cyclase/phosphodiesterase [Sphingomonas sp. Leaf412]|uniref:putative bifunctional diguanylate cyclase/phosphodiesterase n=1 Tax=Sphingomonas sp. Leaf412 TaxID=1736370 RepID=UPI0009EBFBCF|nr:EAL domain-containing protein [Sphingomonas sp. Leaf412]